MKNPRKRRKAGPATACAPDLDLFRCQDMRTCQVTVTADGECARRRSRSAADDLHPECDGRSRHLYVYSRTLDCVLQRQCIPCLYKMFPGGRNDHYLLELLSSTGIEVFCLRHSEPINTNVEFKFLFGCYVFGFLLMFLADAAKQYGQSSQSPLEHSSTVPSRQ